MKEINVINVPTKYVFFHSVYVQVEFYIVSLC